MKSKFFMLFSILLVSSMLLAACAPAAAPTAAPAAPAAPAATEAPAPTAAPVEPTAVPAPTEAPKSTRLGGWLDKVVFSMVADPEPAVAQIQAGTIDLYSATIDKADVFAKVKADANMTSANTYGSSNQLLFNTVECTDKSVNIFTDAKIREAMNWALDRNYVVQEIFGGLAKAKYTPFTTAFPDYARYADLFSAVETKYTYNFEKAQKVVDEEMTNTFKATKDANGKWAVDGKPVKVIGLIRTEDKRKEIGEYFANQLEKLGFTVDRQEKVRKEAAPIWQGDPAPCAFHYYTAGWISPQIYRDEGLNFNQYNTGELQGLPLFNEYKPSKDLLDAGHALYTNSFTTMDERRALFAKALPLSMEESWWGVWVNDTIAFEVASNKVQGSSDLAAGYLAQLYPFTARFAGQEGGTLKIANSAILVDAWNPIAGSNWVDDSIPRNFTTDYGVIYNPYTGLFMNKLVTKAEVVAQEGLPVAAPQSDWVSLKFEKEIKVPDDAWVDWDATKQVFITAAEKAKADPKWAQTAKKKVTVTYTPDLWKTLWHDGSPFTAADFVFSIIMGFDPGKKESKIFDESIGATVDTFLTHFKGVKIVSMDPFTIESYDDSFYLDAENNVVDWYPNFYNPSSFGGGMLAWHNLAPAVQADADGKMAFSKDKSTNKKVDYTSQVSGPTLDVQMEYVEKDLTDKYIPFAATMTKFITPEEAVTRYTNLKTFYAAHKHIVLGTGPYMVDQVFPVEGSISMVRYDKYLFPADQFSGFGEPLLMTVAVDGPTALTAGDETSFDVTINFKDQPYPAKEIDKVAFTLFSANGDIVATGDAESVAEGQYKVTLGKDVTAKLEAGTSKLTIAAASKAVSLPVFETAQFVVTK